MAVQLNIFLLLFGGLQGLLLSLFLIRKRTYRSGYIFLSIYIFVMLLQIILKVVSKIWLMDNMHALYNLSYRLPFLYGPLVYLMSCSLLTQEGKFKPIDLLHFIPFVMATILQFAYMMNDRPSFLAGIFLGAKNSMVLQLISIVVYHSLALSQWYRHRRFVKNEFSFLQPVQVSWLRNFVIVSLVACTMVVLAIFFMYIHYPHWNNLRFLFVVLTLFIYWISYTAMNQPQLFSMGQKNMANMALSKLVVHRPAKKYANSGLKEEDADRLLTHLQKLTASQKPYLDPALTIEDLSEKLSCSRHHLSQVLNRKLKQSFYDYINQLRIEEAKQLLVHPAREEHKIAAIAYDAGFNSLSTFNDVFRKLTGQTPSQYRKYGMHDSQRQRV